MWCGKCVSIPWGKRDVSPKGATTKTTLPSHRSWKPYRFQSGFTEWIAGLTLNQSQNPRNNMLEHKARGLFFLKMWRNRQHMTETTIAKLAMLNTIAKQDNKMTSQSKQAVFLHCSNIGSYPTMRENTWPHHAWLSHDRCWKSSLSLDTKLLLEKDDTCRNSWQKICNWLQLSGFMIPQMELT